MNAYAEAAKLITKARDYKREYKNYHGKPEQIKNRASRNAARRKLAKQGRVKPGDGKDVDHRDHDPTNNDDKNLRVRDMSHNRADNRRKAYVEAAKLMAQVQKAGARHSSKDNGLIQQLHDLACELGAECPVKDMAIHPQLKAAVEALVLRHPGHGNQKVHGNRFGGYGTTKESLRRLKGDKEGRERYKETARKRISKTGSSEPMSRPEKVTRQRLKQNAQKLDKMNKEIARIDRDIDVGGRGDFSKENIGGSFTPVSELRKQRQKLFRDKMYLEGSVKKIESDLDYVLRNKKRKR